MIFGPNIDVRYPDDALKVQINRQAFGLPRLVYRLSFDREGEVGFLQVSERGTPVGKFGPIREIPGEFHTALHDALNAAFEFLREQNPKAIFDLRGIQNRVRLHY